MMLTILKQNILIKYIVSILCISFAAYLISCGNRIERVSDKIEDVRFTQSNEQMPYIKLHTQNGDVYILSDWKVDNKLKNVTGKGMHQNLNRELISEDNFEV
ncbi:MAG: hypothetical protein R3321_11690, partial [Nitrososphaeraceae archaeon]|nr:hypothetical protein [Nitrososphaeraceae archaeon]